MYFEGPASCIIGPPPPLPPFGLRKSISPTGGISVDTQGGWNYLYLRIRQSQADICKDGVLRFV